MRGGKECRRCGQMLDVMEFDVNVSAGRRRFTECRVCRHDRLAKAHAAAASRLLRARRERRDREHEAAAGARAAAGKD